MELSFSEENAILLDMHIEHFCSQFRRLLKMEYSPESAERYRQSIIDELASLTLTEPQTAVVLVALNKSDDEMREMLAASGLY